MNHTTKRQRNIIGWGMGIGKWAGSYDVFVSDDDMIKLDWEKEWKMGSQDSEEFCGLIRLELGSLIYLRNGISRLVFAFPRILSLIDLLGYWTFAISGISLWALSRTFSCAASLVLVNLDLRSCMDIVENLLITQYLKDSSSLYLINV